ATTCENLTSDFARQVESTGKTFLARAFERHVSLAAAFFPAALIFSPVQLLGPTAACVFTASSAPTPTPIVTSLFSMSPSPSLCLTGCLADPSRKHVTLAVQPSTANRQE